MRKYTAIYELTRAQEPASPSRNRIQKAQVATAQSKGSEDDGIEILRQAHDDEVERLLETHSQTVSHLRAEHDAATAGLRKTIEELRQTPPPPLSAVGRKDELEGKLAQKEQEHADVLASLEQEHEAMIKEMETSLASNEEQRRQLKMRADQAMFELSRIRDEGQLQHNNDIKQITDLKRVNSNLEKVKAELETSNNELSKKVSEMELRFSRRPSPLPPQGPPPTSPLPPIPKSPSVATAQPISKFASGSSIYTVSGSSHQGHQQAQPGQRSSNGSLSDIQALIASLPEGPQQNVQKVVTERDSALQQKDLFRQQLASGQERLKDAVSHPRQRCWRY